MFYVCIQIYVCACVGWWAVDNDKLPDFTLVLFYSSRVSIVFWSTKWVSNSSGNMLKYLFETIYFLFMFIICIKRIMRIYYAFEIRRTIILIDSYNIYLYLNVHKGLKTLGLEWMLWLLKVNWETRLTKALEQL